MLMHENDACTGKCNDWPEDVQWRDWTGVKAAECDQIMADDAFPS